MNRIQLKRTALAEAFQQVLSRTGPLLVGDVMTPDLYCVTPETSARKLLDLFQARRVKNFLVVEGEELVGVLCDRDVVYLFGAHDMLEADYLDRVLASELMNTDLRTVTPETSLREAVTKMVDLSLSVLPVVQQKRPVGILTCTDLMLALEQSLALSEPGARLYS